MSQFMTQLDVISVEQEGSTVGFPYSLIEWDEFYLIPKKRMESIKMVGSYSWSKIVF